MITDYTGIPKSDEDFPETLEIYDKVKNAENMLREYDNGNRSTFLKYCADNNAPNHEKEQFYEPVIENER